MKQAGRNHTWNAFVHSISHPQAEFLYLMDSDIVFNEPGTLFNMYLALHTQPEAQISTDLQIKDAALKRRKTPFERLSLATTDMTRKIEGRITGQLYCIRASVARRLWLPQDLGAPDDGFIKAVVCSDFFTHAVDPAKIVTAPNASHLYEAYLTPRAVLDNQKRQMIGQTTVHVLIGYVKSLPWAERSNLAAHLKRKEAADPAWLRRLTQEHLVGRSFWRLFPNVLTFRCRALVEAGRPEAGDAFPRRAGRRGRDADRVRAGAAPLPARRDRLLAQGKPGDVSAVWARPQLRTSHPAHRNGLCSRGTRNQRHRGPDPAGVGARVRVDRDAACRSARATSRCS